MISILSYDLYDRRSVLLIKDQQRRRAYVSSFLQRAMNFEGNISIEQAIRR